MPLFPEPCASGSDWAPVLVLLYCLGKSVVAEVYPSLWTRRFPKEDRDGYEQAADASAAEHVPASAQRSEPHPKQRRTLRRSEGLHH